MRRAIASTTNPELDQQLVHFGTQLKAARLARNLSLETVGLRTGLSKSTLIRIEQGAPSVAFGMVAAYLDFFGFLQPMLAKTAPTEDRIGEALRATRARKKPRASALTSKQYDF